MLPIYFYITITYLFIQTEALRINSVSAKNVAKRESGSDLFAKDFLPFKKQSEEFEELKQKSKVKPKKRLAPPVNFMLRAVEAESDDYYEKGQAESEGEEDFEKKEWSDANRPLETVDKNDADNHTVVSDIDGVVSILVGKPYPLSDIKDDKPEVAQISNTTKTEESPDQNPAEGNLEPSKEKRQQSITTQPKKYEDDLDYDEEINEKKKLTPIPEEEQNANEAKKAGILNSVDDLKERHAQEQRAINEKLKEEEMYIEQQERDKINTDRFSTEHNKYEDGGTRKTSKHLPDYEDYPEESTYPVTPKRAKSTTRAQDKRTTKKKAKTEKKLESGRISVFKNPQLFMVYDDEAETTTKVTKQKKSKSNKLKNNKLRQKYSSSYNSPPKKAENSERISLIPVDDQGRNGEPALFFPKKRKNKKNRTPRPVDSIVAETVSDNQAKKLTTAIVPTTKDLANTETVTSDVIASASDHAEKEKDHNYHREKGGAKEYSSAHEEEHNEEGKKAYEGVHEETKTAEGHHDKENHLGKYDDHGDINKLHEEESGHYGSHEHEEHGKKHAKYEESGKHSKGHSTKGSHDIHKKEEYEKKVEFFEEEGDSAEEEKNGGYHHDKGHSEGGHFKKNGLNAGHEQHSKGESGDHAGGWIFDLAKGHKSAGGNDGHHKHGEDHGAKAGKHSGKKWIYHHGSPARTANLVRIDRRTAPHFSAPYYG